MVFVFLQTFKLKHFPPDNFAWYVSVNILKANIRKIVGGAETLFENTLPDCFFCSMIVLEQNPASPMYRIIVQYST